MVYIESRFRDYRQPWTEWAAHHEQPSLADAEKAIRWLERQDKVAKRMGEESRFSQTEYRIAG